MIKKIAWNTFKNTGDINIFLELKQIQGLEKQINNTNETKSLKEQINQTNEIQSLQGQINQINEM